MNKFLRVCLLAVTFSTPPFVGAVVNYPYPEKKTIAVSNEYASGIPKGNLRIINPDKSAWLVQAWAEDDNREKYSVIFPPLTRLEEYGSTFLQIYNNDVNRSKIRWVVVKIIPPIDKNVRNKITIPIIYRLKIQT